MASSGGSSGGRSESSGRLLMGFRSLSCWTKNSLSSLPHEPLQWATHNMAIASPSPWENKREREPGREASLLQPNIRSDLFITFVTFYSLQVSHEVQSILGRGDMTNEGHEFQKAKMIEGHLSLDLLYMSSFVSGFFCAILFLWNLFILFVWLWIIHSYHCISYFTDLSAQWLRGIW